MNMCASIARILHIRLTKSKMVC